MTHGRAGLRRNEGFSTIEVLLAGALAVVVLGVTLTLFQSYVDRGRVNDKLTAAEDRARIALDEIVRSLRNAGPAGTQTTTVLRATGNDVVLSTNDWPGESRRNTAPHIVRYCVDTGAGKVWFDGLYDTSAGSADPGGACPSTGAGWQHRAVADHVANGSSPLFSYDSATASAVRSVGVGLVVESSPAASAERITLRSGVVIRSRAATITNGGGSPLSSGDINATCNADHSVLLTLGASVDGNGDPLNAVYSENGIALNAGGGSATVRSTSAGSQSHSVLVKVTNVLGLSTFLTKNVTC